MQVSGLKAMVLRWKDHTDLNTIITDRDSTIRAAARELGWNVRHTCACSHAMKSLGRF
jgi:hypothetical protein